MSLVQYALRSIRLLLFRDQRVGVAVTTVSVLVLLLSRQFLKKRISSARLPPGPRGIPFIGNAFLLAGGAASLSSFFPSWIKEYGDIVHFSAFGKHMIVLATLDSAVELLKKRSAVYSDRPCMVAENEVLGWDSAMPFMRYGERFRRHRRLSQALLGPVASIRYSSMHEELVMKLIASISKLPDQFLNHIDLYTAVTSIRFAYGFHIDSHDDPILKMHMDAAAGTFAAPRGLINFFPFLKLYFTSYPNWLPFSGFKTETARLRKFVIQTHDVGYNAALEGIKTGTASESLVNHAVEHCGGLGDMKETDHIDIKGLAGIMFTAGQDTSALALTSFVLAMVRFQDVQKRAQAEINSVIPNGRLPTVEDRESLPYINALVNEVYRWGPPLAVCVPHVTIEDDVYNGYFIPKGTTIFASIYDMLNACPRPQIFSPQRFIDGTDLGNVPKDPREVVFGFGRRRCPGMHIADNSIWTAIAQMLTVFEFLPEIGDNGQEVLPPQDFTHMTFTRRPKPFRCRIHVRKGKEQLIHAE